MKNIILFILLGFFSLTALAEIYRSVDSNGVVTYSDQPKINSTAVALPRANISTVPANAGTSKNNTKNSDATEDQENGADQKSAKKPYISFDLSTPKAQETFQNATEIPMSVYIQPELQPGDTIQFFFDNKPVGKPSTATTAIIQKTDGDTVNLTRGTHTVYAVIYNAKNKIIKTTETVTIFVHYASVNFPKEPLAAPGLQ